MRTGCSGRNILSGVQTQRSLPSGDIKLSGDRIMPGKVVPGEFQPFFDGCKAIRKFNPKISYQYGNI